MIALPPNFLKISMNIGYGKRVRQYITYLRFEMKHIVGADLSVGSP